ncbi:hypothetical protein LCGC14_1377490 [marine sediment metagenome]|uniref:ABC transporter ATP-binding protein n=2 Tax=root TaxID=1 RepID=A0A831QQE7_9FLAO|nr:ABC transporter ATP-binding protein [Pricia antarctica]
MTEHLNIVLEVENLVIGYNGVAIAKNINFKLAKGELNAVIGINGIGKSTLLRTLGNLQPKLAGSICISEKQLENFSAIDLATKLSLVLTESIASKNMSVLELISLGRQPYTNWIGTLTANDKEKINGAVEMLSLKDLQHKKCFELSDGQLQRALIARAIAQDTDIILLDEPTTHLDLYHKARILKVLKSIAHKTGKTIVFTTHEIEMAIQLCDTLFLLDSEKNYFGKPDELIRAKVFEKLFPAETVSFDAATGSFRINT